LKFFPDPLGEWLFHRLPLCQVEME
jgi:hypothetical protein